MEDIFTTVAFIAFAALMKFQVSVVPIIKPFFDPIKVILTMTGLM